MRLFELDDYSELKKWFQQRRLPVPPISALPKIGMIVDNIAAGFLIETNTSIAIIDFYISNPEIDAHRRDYALNAITEALLKHANRLGFKAVKATTYIDAIAKRAKEHGFREIGIFRSFAKEV